ncbi:MAG: 50S ribosomal protein L23 [Candidatus Eiseniibacteriota bacterium]|jgi:large subunit ribosomal protein L23
MRNARDVIRRPLLTEKGVRMREASNQFLFEVDVQANKVEIRQAIEEIFEVKVAHVRTINVNGKPKRLGRFAGRSSAWKKAIVTLEAGQSIEMFDQV